MKSFSVRAKDAVVRAEESELKSCCRRAELTGFALGCGTATLVGGEGICLCLRTEHAASARRAVQLVRDGVTTPEELLKITYFEE